MYSSLGNSLQEFVPIVPGKVSFYVCGPTVYNSPHIGNLRPVIVFDAWRRLFSAIGYDVTFVSNYPEEWDMENANIKRNIVFTWTINRDVDWMSDMGSISFQSVNGGLLRIL